MKTQSAGTRAARQIGKRGFVSALVSVATALAVAIAGYHPYAEDGGIYLASVKRLLDPALYPHDAAFAMEPSRWSLFAPMVAGLARAVHAPLMWVVLGLHVVSVWATLFATWVLAGRCFVRDEARTGAVLLMACWLGLPVAGTALYVMDPYLTARSIATPAMVFAIAGALDATEWGDQERQRRGGAMWAGGLVVCAAMHPLTAMYAVLATMVLACLRAQDRAVKMWGTAAVAVSVLAAAASAQMFAPVESAVYVRAALTRSYWFLSEWRWYEVTGLAAPLAILSAVGWFVARKNADVDGDETAARRALAQMAAVVGAVACVIALVFAREGAATHLEARLQPLRMFQMVYVVMIVLLGGWMGKRVLQRSTWRWGAVVMALGGVMFGAARAEYPGTSHLEMPWVRTTNAWVQGFEWVRVNTPKDALFAMDADYIHAAGEDAQSFRAIAERSVLPDFSKDGGEASIAPDLAEAWVRSVEAQKDLNVISDAERIARLRSLGVTWVVLNAATRTSLDCSYANKSVRVCRLM